MAAGRGRDRAGLKHAVMADYVVLGGGNAKEIEELPDGVRRGHNRTVVEGGRRLFEELSDPAQPQTTRLVDLMTLVDHC